jgi:branched-chain amino acid transport system permease protein
VGADVARDAVRLRLGTAAERALRPLFPAVLVVVTVGTLTWTGGIAMRDMVITMLINVVLVVGLYVFVGTSGVMSFGHMSFMAVGAYLSGLLTMTPKIKAVVLPQLPGFLASAHLSTLAATVVGGVAAAGVALVLAIPLMRLSGLGASIATLALLQIAQIVAKNWESVTGPSGATFGVPTTTTVTTALIWALIVIAAAYVFQESKIGLRLRASREEESAAAAIGVNITRERVVAFVLSAFIVGIGGAIFAHYLGAFSPASFYLSTTFITLAMLVIGGMNSLAGAVVGVVTVSLLSEGLLRVENSSGVPSLREMALALIMLAILVVRPRGITGGSEFNLAGLKITLRRLQRARFKKAAATEIGSTEAG